MGYDLHLSTVAGDMFHRIAQLSDGTHLMRVRIFHVWDGTLPTKPGEVVSYNALLIDEDGQMIQATCYPNVSKWFRRELIAGRIITVDRFSIENNFRTYQYAICEKCIRLTNATVVKPYLGEPIDIPASSYNFTPLNQLMLRGDRNTQLTDVIGYVSAVAYPNASTLSGKQPPSKVITLRDTGLSEATLVVWGALGDHLDDHLLPDRSNNEPIWLACTGLAIKIIDGEARLWTTSGTTIKINDEIPVFADYKDGCPAVAVKINRNVFQNTPRLTHMTETTLEVLINDVQSLTKDRTYVCPATILDIDDSKGWLYKGCPTCPRSVVYREESYCCSQCGVVSSTIPKYKVNLDVADGNQNAFFLCFETAGRRLFNRIASDVVTAESMESIPPNLRAAVKGMRKKFHVTVSGAMVPGKKLTFLVNNIEEIDSIPSGSKTNHQEVKIEAFNSQTKQHATCTTNAGEAASAHGISQRSVRRRIVLVDDEEVPPAPSKGKRNCEIPDDHDEVSGFDRESP